MAITTSEERGVLAVTIDPQLFGEDKAHRGRIRAVPQAGGRGPVIKNVTQVRSGVAGSNFGARLKNPNILFFPPGSLLRGRET